MLRAEFTKLRRPLVLALIVLGASLAVTALVQQQAQGRRAQQDIAIWHEYAEPSLHGPITTFDPSGEEVSCTFGAAYAPGSFCRLFLDAQVSNSDAELLADERSLAAASLTQNPLGVGTLVGGVMASLLGFLLVVILAAGHIGGEWSERTLRTMLIRQPNRWKVLGIKVLSLWLASVAVLAFTWAVLACVALYYHVAKPLDPTGMAGFGATNGPVIVGRCLLVLAVYSLVAAALATIGRGVIGTLIGGVAIGAGSLMAGYDFAAASQHEFVFWVTGFMGYLDPRMIGTGTFWLTTFKVYPQVPTFDGGLLGLAVSAVVCAALGIARFVRSEVAL